VAAVLVFMGFNGTFLPQFWMGFLGMPRRYHAYPEQFTTLNVMSSAGSLLLAVGYALPLLYLLWSLFWGRRAGADPWKAAGLEWRVASPPPEHNFDHLPPIEKPYRYPRPEESVPR
jgi:cytochrome c oxidase subunit 1